MFFVNGTPTTEIYTLSLHDALPILRGGLPIRLWKTGRECAPNLRRLAYFACTVARLAWRGCRRAARIMYMYNAKAYSAAKDRKSTRLNSSHITISYAVFCLKKKRKA